MAKKNDCPVISTEEVALRNTTQEVATQAEAFMEEMARKNQPGTTVLLSGEEDEDGDLKKILTFNELLSREEIDRRTQGAVAPVIAKVRREMISKGGIKITEETLHDRELSTGVMPVEIRIAKRHNRPLSLVEDPDVEEIEDYFAKKLRDLVVREMVTANFAKGDEGTESGRITPVARVKVFSDFDTADVLPSEFSTSQPWSEKYDRKFEKHEANMRKIRYRILQALNPNSGCFDAPKAPTEDDLDEQNLRVASVILTTVKTVLEKVAEATG
jgi:hypothetical protein